MQKSRFLKIFENFGKIENFFTDVQRPRGPEKKRPQKKMRFFAFFFFAIYGRKVDFRKKKNVDFFQRVYMDR